MPFINDLVEANKPRTNQQETDTLPGEIMSRYIFDLRQVRRVLDHQIKGQDHVVEAIINSLKIIKTGLRKEGKPLWVALLAGPTGVGKTQIVRAVAEAVWGKPDAFCRVVMNTLSQEHFAAALTGPPPGYVGSKEGYTVLNKEKIEGTFSKPGIVLFDEIEKADSTVIQSLLNIFDNGYLQMASGNQVFDFRNSLVFMSSNIGARKIIRYHNKRIFLTRLLRKLGWYTADERKVLSLIHSDLNKRFVPEFINRIDKIIAFNWLDRHSTHLIAEKELMELANRVKRLNADMRFDANVVAFIVRTGFDENYGARAIYRAVQNYIERPLAEAIISYPPDKQGSTVYRLQIVKGKVVIDSTN
ncbi:AAA family ATPase [Acidihalobacter prosperus]